VSCWSAADVNCMLNRTEIQINRGCEEWRPLHFCGCCGWLSWLSYLLRQAGRTAPFTKTNKFRGKKGRGLCFAAFDEHGACSVSTVVTFWNQSFTASDIPYGSLWSPNSQKCRRESIARRVAFYARLSLSFH